MVSSSAQEVDKGDGDLKMKSFEKKSIGKCLNDVGWDVVQSKMSIVKTNLRIVANTSLLGLQYLNNGHIISMPFMPGNQCSDHQANPHVHQQHIV